MSNAMYNKMWHQTQEALNSLLEEESQKMIEPHKNQVFIFRMLATFYIKYVQIFRNLEDVYDQIVHPQKRILIRKILDGVMGRILELKNEMVELELTEFHYFDDILQDLKLAPKLKHSPQMGRTTWARTVLPPLGAQMGLLDTEHVAASIVTMLLAQACWNGVGQPSHQYPVAQTLPISSSSAPTSVSKGNLPLGFVSHHVLDESLLVPGSSSQVDATPPLLWVSDDSGVFSMGLGAPGGKERLPPSFLNALISSCEPSAPLLPSDLRCQMPCISSASLPGACHEH
ncbi:hypothetical protein MC885_020409 [Smutsia gigantea]|nr:hypothetical protein MC885_020409 [Smutsia gigantea]